MEEFQIAQSLMLQAVDELIAKFNESLEGVDEDVAQLDEPAATFLLETKMETVRMLSELRKFKEDIIKETDSIDNIIEVAPLWAMDPMISTIDMSIQKSIGNLGNA